MKNGRLIGISGKKGSGKDTFYDIVSSQDPKYINVKFADKLKEICSVLTGLPIEYFYNRKYYGKYMQDWDMTIREMMQRLGTDVLRDNFDKRIWIKSVFSNLSDNQNVIITDVRFENEADAILERGGYLIRIEPTYPGYINMADEHPSENALDNYDKFDFIIQNTNIDEYKQQIKNIMEQINLQKEYQ